MQNHLEPLTHCSPDTLLSFHFSKGIPPSCHWAFAQDVSFHIESSPSFFLVINFRLIKSIFLSVDATIVWLFVFFYISFLLWRVAVYVAMKTQRSP